MDIHNRTLIAFPLILRITVIGALAGAAYGYFAAVSAGASGSLGVARGLASGSIIGFVLTSLNVYFFQQPVGGEARRSPFLVHIGLKSLIYFVVFLVGIAAGQWIVPIPTVDSLRIGLGDILFFVAVSFVVNFLLDLNSLLGQNALLSFATGRYFRPRVEDRIFLIIDMKSSTTAAERLGEIDFHRLLNHFVTDLSGPIVVQKGEIHKYIGDELIATWPLAEGVKDARCLRAYFDAIKFLESLGPVYDREFGLQVTSRASLHSGPIVIGEMGSIKKEIALVGDTLNTASRIVDFCRESGESAIISAALLAQLTVPPGVEAFALGLVPIRGKKLPVELFALRKASSSRAVLRHHAAL